jgi:hypothetical protein
MEFTLDEILQQADVRQICEEGFLGVNARHKYCRQQANISLFPDVCSRLARRHLPDDNVARVGARWIDEVVNTNKADQPERKAAETSISINIHSERRRRTQGSRKASPVATY